MSAETVTTYTDHNGSVRWCKGGILHREDGPAIIRSDGTAIWYLHGKIHREDGPAVTHVSGDQYWYQNSEQHRTDGPAVVFVDGTVMWYIYNHLYMDIDEWLRGLEDLNLRHRISDELVTQLKIMHG